MRHEIFFNPLPGADVDAGGVSRWMAKETQRNHSNWMCVLVCQSADETFSTFPRILLEIFRIFWVSNANKGEKNANVENENL